jgi:hypothetical protein
VILKKPPSRPQLVDLVWLLLLAIATFLVYASSLHYPFFWVDPIDIGLAHSRSVATILTSSEGYLYYRPFAFILWKGFRVVAGRFDPFAFHLLHVLMHLLNSWLMYALAKRVLRAGQTCQVLETWQVYLPAGLAALCFAWFPASHQTVTWVISPQVQAMSFLLASAVLYWDGRTANNRLKLWLSLLLLAIALPFHENAVLFGPILLLLELYLVITASPKDTRGELVGTCPRGEGRNSGELKRLSLFIASLRPGVQSFFPLVHVFVCLSFAVLWLLIPKDPESAVARFEPATGWYLLQGAIWPVAGAAGFWRDWLAEPAWRPLYWVAPLALLLLVLAYGRAGRLSLLIFSLGWFGLMVLPVWATRGMAYTGISPRIFYTAAPGAILAWVGLLTVKPFPERPKWQMGWQVMAFLLIGLALRQSVAFLAAHKRMHDGGMAAVWDVVESGRQAGTAGRLLYINVPDQISPRSRFYPVGYFRAILMPVSVELGQYAELQTGVRPSSQSYALPALAGLEQYPYQVDMRGVIPNPAEVVEAIRAADEVYFSEYDPAGPVRVVLAGQVSGQQAATYLATYGEQAGLVSAEVEQVGGRLRLSSQWACLATFAAEDTLFVHLIDSSGQLIAQADGDPLRALFPLAECRPGEAIHDVRYLPAPASPGSYMVHLGLYNRASGERLVALDNNGRPLADNAAILTVQIVP